MPHVRAALSSVCSSDNSPMAGVLRLSDYSDTASSDGNNKKEYIKVKIAGKGTRAAKKP